MAERPPTAPYQEVTRALTWDTYKLICEGLQQHGGKYRACKDFGFTYATVRDAIANATARNDTEWQELWDVSYAAFQETIEQEAYRRAVLGIEKTVYGRVAKDTDGKIGTEQHYSDSVLVTLLKGHHERYKDRAPVLLGSGLEVPDIFSQLTPEARKQVRDIIVGDLAMQAARHKSEEVRIIEASDPMPLLERASEKAKDMANRKTERDRKVAERGGGKKK